MFHYLKHSIIILNIRIAHVNKNLDLPPVQPTDGIRGQCNPQRQPVGLKHAWSIERNGNYNDNRMKNSAGSSMLIEKVGRETLGDGLHRFAF